MSAASFEKLGGLMYKKCSVDFETRSPVDLKQRGAYVYFAHPQTKILMAAYRVDSGPLQIWTYDQPKPSDLCRAIQQGAKIHAFNAQFETLGFDLLADREGWPRPDYSQYVDTMAAVQALGLPRSLAKAAEALSLEVQKDKNGERLIRKFSIPRKPVEGEDLNGLYWNEPEDNIEDFDLFKKYCMRDVETEEGIAKRIVPLSDDEQAVWLMDQRINRVGVRIDRQSVIAAITLVEKAKAKLDAEMAAVTNRAVTACSQIARLTEWVKSKGVELDGVAKDDILDALNLVDLPREVRQALLLRQEAGKSSTSKLSAFLKRMSADDRVRGAFVYHGAAPGRWSSTGVNVGNMPRPRSIFEDAELDPAELFGAIRTGGPDHLRLLYGPELGRPLHLVSDAIRGFLWAAPGHDFVAADYSNIQGAICAWLSNETWKLEAMREIFADPKNKPDLYRRAAAAIMNSTTDIITKKHPLRQSVGKVSELALGFGGGVSAFHSMAKNYNVNLDMLYEPVWANADEEIREKVSKRFERCLKAKDKQKADLLSKNAWLACDIIKLGWRASNANIVAAWASMEDAMRDAIRNPGVAYAALGRVTYLVARGYLWCRLPSNRCIAYAKPKLKDQVWAKVMRDDGTWPDISETIDRDLAEKLESVGKAKIAGPTKPAITALDVDSTTQKLVRYAVYGGLAMENLCLAIERDILVCGMRNVEAAGYPVVMHVYDEAVSEVPRGFGSVKEFERLMCEVPPVYDGLPIAANGFRAKRYKK
jgi:DNA polymerase